MPGMLLFGRRWMIGSDDLVFPFTIALGIRVLWLLTTCLILGIQHDVQHGHAFMTYSYPSCGFKMDVYLLGYIVVLAGTSCFDLSIAILSSRGTIFREEKRRMIPCMVYTRLVIYLLELIWLGVGIYWVFIEANNCHETTDHRLSQALVLCNVVLMLGIILSIYLSFDTAGHIWYKMESLSKSRSSATYGSIDFYDMIKNEYEKKWEKSCKMLFCCSKLESSAENVFGFVARELAEYFHGEINLVPSDIVAGLILLRRHQQVLEARQIQDELDNAPADTTVVTKKTSRSYKTVWKHQRTISWKPFNLLDEGHRQPLLDAVYFCSYTMAIYGWPLYIYLKQLCSFACCKLCCRVRCCLSCCIGGSDYVRGDNCCGCNEAATKLGFGFGDVNFVYISYHDEVFEPPFFVAVDHEKKAIVISCRGTMSLKDVLTDVMIEEERIPVEGGDPSWKAHSGMLQSAKYVLNHLTSNGSIEAALAWDEDKETHKYKIVVVGHSLGGGVASILAFMLKQQYPDLVCFAYSPPGATFNYAASKYAEDFIYSIVVGKDVIPRMNLYTLNELKYKIVRLIQGTTLAKWQIIRGCLCQCMLCCRSFNKSSHEDYLDIELADIPPFDSEDHRRGYVGGKVIHFVKTKSLYPRYIGKKRAEYEVVWTTPEDLQTILISTLMWKDHLPDKVWGTLRTYAQDDKCRLAPVDRDPFTTDTCVSPDVEDDQDEDIRDPENGIINRTAIVHREASDKDENNDQESHKESNTNEQMENSQSADAEVTGTLNPAAQHEDDTSVVLSPASEASRLLDPNA